jgi:hypothetical protein
MCRVVEHECRKFCVDGKSHAPLQPSPKGMRVKNIADPMHVYACLLTRSRQTDVGEGRVRHEAVGETARITTAPLMVGNFLSSTAASVGPSLSYGQLACLAAPSRPGLVERGAHQLLPRTLRAC